LSTRRAGSIGAAAVSAAVLATVGCGGSSDQSQANAWAGDVCDAIVTWQGELKGAASELKSGTPSKQSLQDALTRTQKATKTFVADLKAIDAPKGQGAQAAKDELGELSGQLQHDRATIAGAIDGVSGAADVLTAVSTVTGALATAKQQIEATVDTLKGLDLDGDAKKAFDDASACDPLTKR
jgi:uncharacterized phage infection (PIP) family protein YhgE